MNSAFGGMRKDLHPVVATSVIFIFFFTYFSLDRKVPKDQGCMNLSYFFYLSKKSNKKKTTRTRSSFGCSFSFKHNLSDCARVFKCFAFSMIFN